jgi:hypothetical protein
MLSCLLLLPMRLLPPQWGQLMQDEWLHSLQQLQLLSRKHRPLLLGCQLNQRLMLSGHRLLLLLLPQPLVIMVIWTVLLLLMAAAAGAAVVQNVQLVVVGGETVPLLLLLLLLLLAQLSEQMAVQQGLQVQQKGLSGNLLAAPSLAAGSGTGLLPGQGTHSRSRISSNSTSSTRGTSSRNSSRAQGLVT